MQLIMTIGEATVASRYKLLSVAVTVVTASGCPGKPRFIVLCFTELHRRHFFFFLNKLKARPSTSRKIMTSFIAILTLSQRSGPEPAVPPRSAIFDWILLNAYVWQETVSRPCSISGDILVLGQDSSIGNSTALRNTVLVGYQY